MWLLHNKTLNDNIDGEDKATNQNPHDSFPYITLALRIEPLLVRESVYIKPVFGASSWFA